MIGINERIDEKSLFSGHERGLFSLTVTRLLESVLRLFKGTLGQIQNLDEEPRRSSKILCLLWYLLQDSFLIRKYAPILESYSEIYSDIALISEYVLQYWTSIMILLQYCSEITPILLWDCSNIALRLLQYWSVRISTKTAPRSTEPRIDHSEMGGIHARLHVRIGSPPSRSDLFAARLISEQF